MVRPRKCRRLSIDPAVRFYKPQDVPMRQMSVLSLKEEEFEALALAEVEGLDHEAAAERMEVSRPTFSRILGEARKTVALALVQGAALKIEGGSFYRENEQADHHSFKEESIMPNKDQTGPMGLGCRKGEGRGAGRGRFRKGFGEGQACGQQRGRGFAGGCAVEAGASKEDKMAFIEKQIVALQERLELMKKEEAVG